MSLRPMSPFVSSTFTAIETVFGYFDSISVILLDGTRASLGQTPKLTSRHLRQTREHSCSPSSTRQRRTLDRQSSFSSKSLGHFSAIGASIIRGTTSETEPDVEAEWSKTVTRCVTCRPRELLSVCAHRVKDLFDGRRCLRKIQR